MKIDVARYRKADGHITRYWSVTVNGELLVVTLYRKGAEAVARAIATPGDCAPNMVNENSPKPGPPTSYGI